MANKKYNQVFINEEEHEVIKALLLIENYCLFKRGIGKDDCDCDSCVMSVLLQDGEGCPFDEEHHAPGDLEVREDVYNGGSSLILSDTLR